MKRITIPCSKENLKLISQKLNATRRAADFTYAAAMGNKKFLSLYTDHERQMIAHKTYGVVGRPVIHTKPGERKWYVDPPQFTDLVDATELRWDLRSAWLEYASENLAFLVKGREFLQPHVLMLHLEEIKFMSYGFDVDFESGFGIVSLDRQWVKTSNIRTLLFTSQFSPFQPVSTKENAVACYLAFLCSPFIEHRFSGSLIYQCLMNVSYNFQFLAQISKCKPYSWSLWLAKHLIDYKIFFNCPPSPLACALWEFDMQTYATEHWEDFVSLCQGATQYHFDRGVCNYCLPWIPILQQDNSVKSFDSIVKSLEDTYRSFIPNVVKLKDLTNKDKHVEFYEHVHYIDRFNMITFMAINETTRQHRLPTDVVLCVLDFWRQMCNQWGNSLVDISF